MPALFQCMVELSIHWVPTQWLAVPSKVDFNLSVLEIESTEAERGSWVALFIYMVNSTMGVCMVVYVTAKLRSFLFIRHCVPEVELADLLLVLETWKQTSQLVAPYLRML